MNTSIEMINCPENIELSDSYSGDRFVTKSGVGFLMNGLPVSTERAMKSGFVLSKDFKRPTFFRKSEVSEYLTKTLKVPRGTETYNYLYGQFAGSLPPDAF